MMNGNNTRAVINNGHQFNHHSPTTISTGLVNVNNTNGSNTCIVAKVKAQVMTRDDSTGLWLPISGGGLSHVMLIRRHSSPPPPPNNIISSSSIPNHPSSLNNVILPINHLPIGNNLQQEQQLVCSSIDNQVTVTPIGQSNVTSSMLSSPNSLVTNNGNNNVTLSNSSEAENNISNNYEYIIVGTRISDKNVS